MFKMEIMFEQSICYHNAIHMVNTLYMGTDSFSHVVSVKFH